MELISGGRKRDEQSHQFLGQSFHSLERPIVCGVEFFEELKTQTILNKETRRKYVTAAHIQDCHKILDAHSLIV